MAQTKIRIEQTEADVVGPAGATDGNLAVFDGATGKIIKDGGAPGGGGGYLEGTSFPGGPSTNDKYYRTDRNLLYFYDGTRWLTTTLYFIETDGNRFTFPISSPNNTACTVVTADHDMWLEKMYVSVYVVTTNNGSNYWTMNLSLDGGATIATINTSAISANTWTKLNTAIGAAVGSATIFINIAYIKTSSPGTLYVSNLLSFRLIG